MHVGFDLLFLVPGATGGRETYTREIMLRLRALRPDWRFTAFVAREAAGDGWWREAADDVVVLAGASGRARLRWAMGELVLLPRAAARAGVDVLHSPANFGPVRGPFARVLTVHDVIWMREPEGVPALTRALTTAMVRGAARRAHRVVTESDVSRDDAVELLGVAPARIRRVTAGIVAPPPPGGGDADAGRAAARAPDSTPIALCVAGNVPHKNLPGLIGAVGAIPEADRPLLVLAGRGTDELAGPAWVRALGIVSDATLEDLYAAADVFVLATRYEGFGLPVLEALARGVPVVCSDVPTLREVAGDAAMYFDWADQGAIAAAVSEVLAGDDEQARRVALGRERAAGYSWDVAADQAISVYEEAVAAWRRR